MGANQRVIRIVYVEDELEMIDLVKLILARQRADGITIEVHGATGGRMGIDLIKDMRPDLVLLDIMMPEVDGWQVYQAMKDNEANERNPCDNYHSERPKY